MADSTILRDADKTIRVLFEISNAVTNAVDLSGLYREIHLSLGKILNTDNIAIALYHEDKDALTFPYFVDEMDFFYCMYERLLAWQSMIAEENYD